MPKHVNAQLALSTGNDRNVPVRSDANERVERVSRNVRLDAAVDVLSERKVVEMQPVEGVRGRNDLRR